MIHFGKFIILLGVILVIIGGIVLLSEKLGMPLGKLPGDIIFRKGNTTVYFPLVTSLLVSILLTIIFWLLRK